MTEYMKARLYGQTIERIDCESVKVDGSGPRILVITFDTGRQLIVESNRFQINHANGFDVWESTETPACGRQFGAFNECADVEELESKQAPAGIATLD